MEQHYQLLALDLDGTLTNSEKVISPRTLSALQAAQAKGVKIVLASGRPSYGIRPLADELSLDKTGGFILAYNGGKVIDCRTDEVVYERKLDGDLVPLLHDEALKAGLNILVHQKGGMITTDDSNPEVQLEGRINRSTIIHQPDFWTRTDNVVNKCLIVGEREKVAALEAKLRATMSHRMDVYCSMPEFLECVPKGIDKGDSLSQLAQHMHIAREAVMACGDGENDLSMIRYAGLGIAMANAVESVKAAADFVTLSNDEDGVAYVVERFVLEKV